MSSPKNQVSGVSETGSASTDLSSKKSARESDEFSFFEKSMGDFKNLPNLLTRTEISVSEAAPKDSVLGAISDGIRHRQQSIAELLRTGVDQQNMNNMVKAGVEFKELGILQDLTAKTISKVTAAIEKTTNMN